LPRTLFIAIAFSLSAVVASAEDLSALADEAVAASPSITALRAHQRALVARAEVAGAWPDPMMMVEYSNAPVTTFSIADHPMSGVLLKTQQTLRPPGWSRLQRQVGDHRAQAMDFAVAEAEIRLRVTVERTWWLLVHSRLLKTVTEAHLARTEDLLAAARSRYETGSVGQHAVLRLEVLRDRLTDELGDFQRSDTELTAALTAALGRQSSTPFPTPEEVAPLPLPDPEGWMDLATEHRPLLRQITQDQQAAERAAALARVDVIPDINLWAGYRLRTAQTPTDPGTDLLSLGVGIPIPAGSARRSGGQRRAWLDEASGASARLDASILEITADIEIVTSRWRRAWDKAQTLDTLLIPGAMATLQTTQADFSVGRADFASLFEAEVALLDLDRARITAAIQTHLQRAEATAVLGISPPGVAL